MNANATIDGTPWSRWLVEIVVIVLSILLAFGIEAWWAERQDRQEEKVILAGLQREFLDYRDRLTAAIEKHGEMLDAMGDILQATEEGRWVSSRFSLDEAVMRTLWPPTTELGGGVRDALVQAGGLELLSSRELRERLALWPGVYAEVYDDEVFSRNFVFDRLVPHLTSHGYDMTAALMGLTSLSRSTDTGIGMDPAETQRLLSDRTYRALIQVRYGFWMHAREEYQNGLTAVEEILALISDAH